MITLKLEEFKFRNTGHHISDARQLCETTVKQRKVQLKSNSTRAESFTVPCNCWAPAPLARPTCTLTYHTTPPSPLRRGPSYARALASNSALYQRLPKGPRETFGNLWESLLRLSHLPISPKYTHKHFSTEKMQNHHKASDVPEMRRSEKKCHQPSFLGPQVQSKHL